MQINRRRFISFVSAACLTGVASPVAAFRWQGVALGARAQIVLDHPEAEAITRGAKAEIDRLEGIFSLYRANSEIMRLNRDGWLDTPSFEMLECLVLARRVYGATGGRFDPTVQPLWRVLAEAGARGSAPDRHAIDVARSLIGFDRVKIDTGRITLGTGQALTLNGIAQGFIADKVADLMRARGVEDVLIDTGEIVALGNGPERAGWPVTIFGEDRARLWQGRALASSATLGTVMDADGRQGHILSPDGMATLPAQVTVSAPSAGLADALSTALCLVPDAQTATKLLSLVKEVRLERFIQTST
ncbi:FAD:protein FMN transferase [Sinisalibacter aestuarii]|uniref:FAD:protein FMN transferase n=1 Tax=Sinisalibacter aestuarii TaxID=2949426 RepID=A0ABQ5LSC7_9RHOB|nr:FAD:protein FMN transferase [Sinisalibacter aestuarii]GKY87897.1 FAD:protein FMN transferase [Sinisalibacter aestuarii]